MVYAYLRMTVPGEFLEQKYLWQIKTFRILHNIESKVKKGENLISEGL